MTVGSLFAGIGGFDLAFQWAGFETRWQVEWLMGYPSGWTELEDSETP